MSHSPTLTPVTNNSVKHSTDSIKNPFFSPAQTGSNGHKNQNRPECSSSLIVALISWKCCFITMLPLVLSVDTKVKIYSETRLGYDLNKYLSLQDGGRTYSVMAHGVEGPAQGWTVCPAQAPCIHSKH